MKVLIAEDDSTTREILAGSLLEWGYDAIQAVDGNDAWEKLQENNAPNLLILDWMMPGINGIELCQRLRSQQDAPYRYIILLTSKSDQQELLSGLYAGADDYVIKPYDPIELIIRLKNGTRILQLVSELSQAFEQLKDHEQQQTEFIAALTHDLRTPLVAEKRALAFLQSCSTTDAARQLPEFLQSLVKNNVELLNLVNHILESFQTDEYVFEPLYGSVNLHALVTDCFSTVFPLALEKNIQLTNEIPESISQIPGDSELLKRVLINLTANAISNIPNGSVITANATEQTHQTTVFIKDNGQGINPEYLPHLFKRYYSCKSESDRLGSGLGLYICKKILNAHGGEIQVESILGQGTCFSCTLPKIQAENSCLEKNPYKVLIVDDQELARLGLKSTLNTLDEVTVIGTAQDGAEAVSIMSKLQPDIVLMDITMPKMDGITATRSVKANFPDTKVLMLTSQTGNSKIDEAMDAGADGYCMKDITTHQLINAMTSVMKGNRWMDPTLNGKRLSPP